MKYLIFSLIITFSVYVSGQQKKYKFGKISEEELLMTSYDKDSTAEAIFLYDKGYSHFFSSDPYKPMQFEHKFRIKILKKDGLGWADVVIPYYISSSGYDDDVTGLSACTYNYVDGKIVKSKLDRSSIYIEKRNKNWKLKKFSLPDVKVGSVIEVKYTINSRYFGNLRSWDFQSTIPTAYSEYIVKIPEFLLYTPIQRGYIRIDQEKKYESTYNTSISCYNYTVSNVPAFKVEPFISNRRNYISSISFEIMAINHHGLQIYEEYATSWSEVIRDLYEHDRFGKELKKSLKFLELQATIIDTVAKNDMEKIRMAHDFMCEITWNGSSSKYVGKGIKTAYDKKLGNAADINLGLVKLLRELDFIANPVALSTRNNGILMPGQISESKLNYVICQVHVNDSYMLLDATDNKLPYFLLPERCLNETGRIIHPVNNKPVSLTSNVPSKATLMLNFKINTEEQILEGMVQDKRENYAAYKLRKKISTEKDQEDFLRKKEENNPGFVIKDFKTTDKDKKYKPITCSYNFIYENAITQAGNILYFNPIILERKKETPFKLENRDYPVDFVYPFSHKLIFNIQLPEGYSVDEVPQSVKYVFGENSGTYLYRCQQVGGMIQIISELNIAKSLFSQIEYKELKGFYESVVAKQAENIVLVKN